MERYFEDRVINRLRKRLEKCERRIMNMKNVEEEKEIKAKLLKDIENIRKRKKERIK